MAGGWELLDSVTANGSTTVITTDTFLAKTQLHVEVKVVAVSGDYQNELQFNADTGTNYAIRISDDGGTDSTSYTGASAGAIGDTANHDCLCETDIMNIASKEKLYISHSMRRMATGADNLPQRQEVVGKWTRTSGSGTGDASSQITKISYRAEGETIASGTVLNVWGAESQSETPFTPNLPAGTIFEQTDDYKYYMWDGVDTWTVMVAN